MIEATAMHRLINNQVKWVLGDERTTWQKVWDFGTKCELDMQDMATLFRVACGEAIK